MKIGVVGLGFVGAAMYKSFLNKNLIENKDLFGYDKFKNEGKGIGSFKYIIDCDIIFLALPTMFNESSGKYDLGAIYETCDNLVKNNYNGIVVIKSTVAPHTTDILSDKYKLSFIHNPEFLTARTAYNDFNNQFHIILGKGKYCSKEQLNILRDFYVKHYKAEITLCESVESESMKIFANSFYAVKIQFFTELYILCKKINCDFDKIREMMIKNNWINPQHTNIPGPDGDISYGGLCFPKDTNALNEFMKEMNSPNKILDNTIKERNEMRNDNLNCFNK